jgi:hypothetical protein
MATWDDLKVALIRLREDDPGALAGYPDPRVDHDRHPPFGIDLAAWATEVAADLHSRFGRDVELVVGALDYPSCTLRHPRRQRPTVAASDSLGLTARLDGPLAIRSGHSERHGLLIHNAGRQDIGIVTNGHLTADVVDPETGLVIGGFTGAQRLPRVVFPIQPGATERIPLLVGTASFVPALGYAVPVGEWALQVTLGTDDCRSSRTASLPFTVTS